MNMYKSQYVELLKKKKVPTSDLWLIYIILNKKSNKRDIFLMVRFFLPEVFI